MEISLSHQRRGETARYPVAAAIISVSQNILGTARVGQASIGHEMERSTVWVVLTAFLTNGACMTTLCSLANHVLVNAGREDFDTYLSSGLETEVHTDPYFTGGDRLLDLTFTSVSDNGQWPMAFEKEIRAHSSSFSNDQKFVNLPMQSSPGLEPSEEACSRHCTKISTTSNADSESNDLTGPLQWTTNTEKNLKCPEGEISSSTTNAGLAEEKHFFGLGEYHVMGAPLNIAGLVHPLPPQDGIPGWQRFTMVSYETPRSGSPGQGYLDAKEADLHAATIYEGVMLPGDSIIIGRYSMGDEYRNDDDPDQFLQRGTFIYWLAPDEASDDDDDDDGAEHDDGDIEAEND